MRRRLVVAFVALAVLVVVLYGVPRAFLRADQIQDREQEQLDYSVLLLAELVTAQEEGGQTVTASMLEEVLRPGERVEYVAADGTTVAAGDPADREAGVEASASVPGGGSLTLDYSEEALDERVRDAVLPLIVIGLLLVALAWLAARVLARRLVRPFRELEGHARALGSGHFDLDIPHYDVPEAEEIGQALLTSARDLDQMARRERELTVNASHELRTPLTAARLRLEDLVLWPSTAPEVSAEIGEVLREMDRMDVAVATLLERERATRAVADNVDLGALAAEAAARWRPRLAQRDRELHLDAGGDLRARVAPALIREVLDALLAQVSEHGQGRVTLHAVRALDYLELTVSDEGRRTQGSEMLRPSDADPSSPLPRAAELAAAAGGNLAVGGGPARSFVLRLPPPSAPPDRGAPGS